MNVKFIIFLMFFTALALIPPGAAGELAVSSETLKTLAKAQGGDAVSQTAIGIYYFDGSNGMPKQPQEGYRWLEKAARQKHVKAQVILAVKLYLGQGINQDYRKAALLFRDAALAGDPVSKSMLGGMYRDGKGLKQNNEKAVYWLKKGAEGGDPGGMVGLSTLYLIGQGVRRDNAESIKWGLAACYREKQSCARLDTLATMDGMTAEDVEEGKKRAAPLLKPPR